MKKNTFNFAHGRKHVIFCQSSPVDEFYCETIIGNCDEKEAQAFCNPLQVLLNQKRLDKLGQMNIDQWLAQFDLQKSSAIEQLRKQCSDADLLATIKSRRLQAPAEILAWSRYMSQNLDKFNKQVQEVIKAQQPTDVDPDPDPDSPTVNIE